MVSDTNLYCPECGELMCECTCEDASGLCLSLDDLDETHELYFE